MSESPASSLALAALLLAAAVPVVGSTGHPGTDNSVTRIEVAADGDATWVLQVRTRLADDDAVEGYEAFQASFRENRSAYLDPYRSRMGSLVADAGNRTGRSMDARNFTASTTIQTVPRRWGVVTYEFTWTNFARQRGDALLVGDVFENGMFIAENDTLQLVAPEGHVATSVEPEPDERGEERLVWTGRRDFAHEQPGATFEPAADRPSSGDELGNGLVVGGLLGGLAVLAAVGFAYRTYGGGLGDRGGPDDPEPAADAAESTSTTEDAEPAEIVSDEERVRRLLAEAGGRRKQSEIVEEVDWSKSKVSRVIARLEDEGVVSKVRIGRENVVELTEE